MTISAIKEAIARLPEEDRHSLTVWLNDLGYDDWDRQMVADFSPGGRGTALIEKIERDIAQGKAVPFEHGLKQARTKPSRQSR